MSKNDNRNYISDDVKEFAKISWKKYKKQNKDYYDSKKELKRSYQEYLLDMIPDVIEFLIRKGHIKNEEIQEVKTACLVKLNDPEFVKYLKKVIKADDYEVTNIKLLPIIIREILQEGEKANTELLAKDPNAKTYDLSDLVELSQLIVKKKMKKLTKEGISVKLAFDILSVVPSKKALEISTPFRIRTFYGTLYEDVKANTVPFDKIMGLVVPANYYPAFITFALLERKQRFNDQLSESQMKLWAQISSWCFNTMEKLDKEIIEDILKSYVRARRLDDEQGKDSPRRYSLVSLSEDEYPRIVKTVNKLTVANEANKKYFQ